MNEQVNLNELSMEQLEQVATNLSVSISQAELTKAVLLNNLAQVLAQMEALKKKQEPPTVDPAM